MYPLTAEERTEMKSAARTADALTPLAKMMGSEYANQNAYDCIQVHGGSGYMKEYACERLYRDARITSIYEGTSQLQVVAAIRYVLNGSYAKIIDSMTPSECDERLKTVNEKISTMVVDYKAIIESVNEANNPTANDFAARSLVEMSALLVMSRLLFDDASRNDSFDKSLTDFVNIAQSEMAKHLVAVKNILSANI